MKRILKYIIVAVFILGILSFRSSALVYANQLCDDSECLPDVCQGGNKCVRNSGECFCGTYIPNPPPQPPPGTENNPFGEITNPISGGSLGPNGGLIALLNNVLRLMFVGSGIYAFIQVMMAGFGFITAGGDAKKIEQAWNTIWQSLLGVVIIISSIALAALLGLLLFGSYDAILSPKIYGPGL